MRQGLIINDGVARRSSNEGCNHEGNSDVWRDGCAIVGGLASGGMGVGRSRVGCTDRPYRER
jgi:hypothetical protein